MISPDESSGTPPSTEKFIILSAVAVKAYMNVSTIKISIIVPVSSSITALVNFTYDIQQRGY